MIPRPVTWLLVIVCAVLVPIGVVSAWTATMLSDTDKYVETVGPLADDPEVTSLVADELHIRALQAIGAPANTRPQVQTQVRVATVRAITGPEFPQVWRDANRVVHKEMVKLLSGETLPSGEVVEIDLSPLAGEITAELAERGVRVDLSNTDLTVEVAPSDDLEQARTVWQAVQTAGYWLPVVAGVLIVLTLVTARRRLATLGHLAGAVALTLIATRILVWVADSIGSDQIDDTAQIIWDVLISSLGDTLTLSIVVAVVVLVLRIAIGLGTRVRDRDEPEEQRL